jgi:hypothetical protein
MLIEGRLYNNNILLWRGVYFLDDIPKNLGKLPHVSVVFWKRLDRTGSLTLSPPAAKTQCLSVPGVPEVPTINQLNLE